MAAAAPPQQASRDAATFHKRKFQDFLQHDFPDGTYADRIRAMLDKGERRLVIDINKLRSFDPNFVREFILNPSAYLPPFEDALKSEVSRLDEGGFTKNPEETEYYIGVEGSFGANHISPRGLSSHFIRNLVCVEGIVTKCSLVRPKVVKSVHYCEKTSQIHTRTYQDSIASVGAPTPTAYPTKDENGNPLVTEFGLCTYKDSQMISIQEMPERAPPGQLPRSVDIILENDLVDRLKPGDRVQVVGIYRALPSVQGQTARGVFRTILLANNLKAMTREACSPVLSEQDIKNIRQLAESENAFELLASSLAPSIYGHEFIKKSLLLLLLGGVERNLDTGTHLRGDINILLIGDPSTAKSQLLRFVLHIAPLAISTSGRGSSGVGLTAAVTTDSETGERRLEAGAMVLADRGVVCIDEFDKMSVDDRVAIHEVMEQQTVTIAKAGIHTTLNARCSVVAAANPVYGKYNKQKKPTENIGLPDSLLSRFDLLFIVLDNLNATSDRDISDHVLRMHRYRRPGEFEGEVAARAGVNDIDEEDVDENASTPVFQPFDRLLHGSDKKRDIISILFIQKYILFAKNRYHPKLTPEARDFIIKSYSDLRAAEDMKTLPVTPRTLETIIRLATAHAKCNLRNEVRKEDAEVAIDLMRYALYHDARPIPKNPQPSDSASQPQQPPPGSTANDTHDNGDNHNDGDDGDDDDNAPGGASGGRSNGNSRRHNQHDDNDAYMEERGDDSGNDDDNAGLRRSQDKGKRPINGGNNDQSRKKTKSPDRAPQSPDASSAQSSVSRQPPSFDFSPERQEEFIGAFSKLLRKKKANRIHVDDIAKELTRFSRDEIDSLLSMLQERGQVLRLDSYVSPTM